MADANAVYPLGSSAGLAHVGVESRTQMYPPGHSCSSRRGLT